MKKTLINIVVLKVKEKLSNRMYQETGNMLLMDAIEGPFFIWGSMSLKQQNWFLSNIRFYFGNIIPTQQQQIGMTSVLHSI